MGDALPPYPGASAAHLAAAALASSSSGVPTHNNWNSPSLPHADLSTSHGLPHAPGTASSGKGSTRPANGAGATARAVDYTPRRTGEGSAIKRSAKACMYCRKGKARCDGLDSWPCRRCRENGVECVFEGLTQEELRSRMSVKRESQAEGGSLDGTGSVFAGPVSAAQPGQGMLESRLARLEAELDFIRSATRSHTARLDRLEDGSVGNSSSPGESSRSRSYHHVKKESQEFETFARDAFELFWEMYAPLAPYIVPTTDTFGAVRDRSPLLMHAIVAVASRHSLEKHLVDFNRSEALRLMRDTLYGEKPVTIDDLKGMLVWNAWLGKGAPPGHTVTLALQLDLPRALDRLLASISQPQAEAAREFEELMPGVRVWLTLYAADLWLSFAMARRSLVTIDLSITSSRLLLHFGALRPVDARLIAQSELVTILGVVQESFLKTQRQSVEQTVHVVQQANAHLEQWITTWSAWTRGQEEETGNFVLSSFSVMLQAARFYANTFGLRDITSSDQLLPIHMPCLRTALDAAVRIQGIHRAHKIAHSAEMTLIVLSSSALFLLKMIKLAPAAFSPVPSPSYPSFASLSARSFGTMAAHLSPADPLQSASSPDTAASPLLVATPSIAQAIDAARHSAALLACAPAKQRSYAHAVQMALQKLEVDLPPTLPPITSSPGFGEQAGGDRKRQRLAEETSEMRRRMSSLDETVAGSANLASPLWAPASTSEAQLPPAGDAAAMMWGLGAGPEDPFAAGGSAFRNGDAAASEKDLDELTISSLIGTDSFWTWTSSLPGESIQALVS
ncbi:hypothetical protein NBRC10513v2_003916 [Rhodotorula toruloides]|uniref:BY PROTMAP: gi/472586163/gb/EMS23691.1/ Zn(2)-C6 transcription factor [Rhodosporidium toruloides NP11] gi/647397751/emb/CDR40987.1/ RHTO0S05e10396g1_1 [Rhodosporidium toruloides] n=1 Tax=Rhodotorula toruloides TaxID=5286 RepID=A0A0K3CSW9_RHOTO|nr:hypothetical protein AAT19DRAFT_10394 [Rhodotorula toruloides]